MKGLLATAAIMATAKVVAASEMLGNEVKSLEVDPPESIKFDPINYRGEWNWVNLSNQSIGVQGRYSFTIGN